MELTELSPYQKIIHTLSERIVVAQKEIRILNAIKWPPEIQRIFFSKKIVKKYLKWELEIYERNPFNFDPN